jgi:hypothetical protein
MAEDIIRNGSGAGYGAKRSEALPPQPAAVPPVPPMEAEWLRAVGGRPGGLGGPPGANGSEANGPGTNGSGSNGAGPNGRGPNGAGPKS